MDPVISFPEGWTPPRELARALPRDVSMSGRGIFKATVAVVLMVASVPAFLFLRNHSLQQAARIERLRVEGREATGEIVRLWRSGDRSATHMVAYAFSADGRRLRGEASAPPKLWDGLRKAGFLPVRYLPSDPGVNHPAAWDESRLPVWLVLLFPAMLLGGGVVILVVLRRQATLLAEGLTAPGVVTRCLRTKDGWRVRYQFRMKDGAVAKGSAQMSRRLEAGATLCVLYLQQNPRRNQTYPVCSYRLAP
jgi:hypothetical protein